MDSERSTHPSRPLLRSCEACRASKSKCLTSESSTSRSCQRCTKLGKSCIFAYAQPRPKRGRLVKPTGRVAAVEEKINNIQSLLESLHQTKNTNSATSSSSASNVHPTPSSRATKSPSPPEYNPAWKNGAPSIITENADLAMPTYNVSSRVIPTAEPRPDIIARGIVSFDYANVLLQRYRKRASHFIFVEQLHNADLQTLRSQNPFLLTVILNIGAWTDQKLREVLDREFREQLGIRIMVEGEKSLDVLQGILVYLGWCHLYYNPQKQQMYLLTSSATAIAVELGIYKSGKKPEPQTYSHSPFSPNPPPANTMKPLVEHHRISACCYYICASLALSLRRPNLFKFNDYIELACEQLAQRREVQTDIYLVHCVRFQRLAEEATETFGYVERSSTQMGPETVQYTVKSFETRLASMYGALPEGSSDIVTLQLAYHKASITIHEIALHDSLVSYPSSHPDHPNSANISTNTPSLATLFSSPRTRNLMTLLDCTRSCLDYILTIPSASFAQLACVDLVHLVYALIVLGKLALNPHLAAVLSQLNCDIRLMHYLDGIVRMSAQMARYNDNGAEIRDAYWHFRALCEGTRRWYEERVRKGQVGTPAGVGKEWPGGRTARREDPSDLDPLQVTERLHADGSLGSTCGVVADFAAGNGAGSVEEGLDGMFPEGFGWLTDEAIWDDMMAAWPMDMQDVM